jgi:hypothetical protein
MPNICQVSLSGNIPIINENMNNFENFYEKNFFYIIVPNKNTKLFKKKIKKKNVKVINENSILSFSKFKKISNKYLRYSMYYKKIQNRLTWYYQQVLKISFLIDFVENKKEGMVIWDADTILIDKLNFYQNNFSCYYGTTSYFYKAYYFTNKFILNGLPKYFLSSLAQFISVTPKETKFLVGKLKKKKKRSNKTSEWITHIIMNSVVKTHKIYNGSMFSEYELIGQSQLMLNYKKQILISGIRENLNGKLSNLQKNILKFLGFKYIAYEHTHRNIYSLNMLKREQTWGKFFWILIKKISNNLYRGARHHINFFLDYSIKRNLKY